ncbi:MAG: pentapeptide repeat-containing protein [Spirulinaceae cyanobacterium]
MMKARDVLRRYATGERDFRGANLRGLSFKGKCLAGADFSGADIRGTSFTGVDLTGVKFCEAKAGLQRRQVIVNLTITFVMSMLSGVLSWGPAIFIILTLDSVSLINVLMGWVSLAVVIVITFVVIRKGVMAGLIVITVAIIIAGALVVTGARTLAVIAAGTLAVAGLFIGSGVVAFTLAIAVAETVVVAIVGLFVGAGAVMVTGTTVAGVAESFAGLFVGAGAAIVAEIVTVVGTVTVTVLFTGLNTYLAWRAMHGDPRDLWIRSTAIAFAAWGGTSFRGADLTDADFSKAQLKCCDFRPGQIKHKFVSTQLVRTCFQNTNKLEILRPGQTILRNASIRNLLINPENGYGKNLFHANFYGAYLKGANLENANLKGANLHHADLSEANLKNANLMKTSVLDADFSGAYLTGAYIGSWNIDTHTCFKNVDCQYIYLLEQPNELGSRERRPHDPNKVFAPGDFERLYTQLMHTVEILLKGGMNREAFAAAFNKIVQENPEITWDSIQSIEKKGDDVLLTVEVPPETDKAQIEQTFDSAYVARLEAQAEAQSLRAQDMKDIALALANQKNTINVKAESKAMSDNPNISIGGDFKGNLAGGDLDASGSAQNFDNLNSTLTTAINQLPEPSEPEQPNLKTILSELQTAINATELDPDDQAEALEQLQILLEAGQNPQDSAAQKAAKRAATWFKGITANLSTTATLVVACQRLLPLIGQYFGF